MKALAVLAMFLGALFAGCARPVVMSAEQLAQAAPYESALEQHSRSNAPPPGGAVDVMRDDGRIMRVSQAFDVLIVPRRGPTRTFMRPVAARVEDEVLFISGSNRRSESRIRVEDIASITVFR